jgi:hypothetical protein
LLLQLVPLLLRKSGTLVICLLPLMLLRPAARLHMPPLLRRTSWPCSSHLHLNSRAALRLWAPTARHAGRPSNLSLRRGSFAVLVIRLPVAKGVGLFILGLRRIHLSRNVLPELLLLQTSKAAGLLSQQCVVQKLMRPSVTCTAYWVQSQ